MFCKRNLILFLVGATVGSFFDGFHTHSGTTAYAHPWIWQMAWWVPPLFGAATVGIGVGRCVFDRFLKNPPRALGWSTVLLGFTAFGALYYASAFLSVAPVFKFCVLGAAAILLWIAMDRTLNGLAFAAITALIGCLVEITLIRLGTFWYLRPEFFGIPYWLPFLYVGAAMAVGNLSRRLSP